MPLLGTTGAASARGFGFLAAGGIGAPYWLGIYYGSASTYTQANGIAVDATGNVVVIGTSNALGSGNYEQFVVKYNASGVVQWQRRLYGGSSSNANGVGIDGAGNVYVCGRSNADTSGGAQSATLVKYDSSGTLQWKKAYTVGNTTEGNRMFVDAAGNSYVAIQLFNGANYDAGIIKVDTSGNLLWQRKLASGVADNAHAAGVDSSGNVYVSGRSNNSTGTMDYIVAKWDSSGVIQWQRWVGTSYSADYGYGIAVSPAGNCYVAGWSDDTGINQLHITKIDTSGSLVWDRAFGSTSAQGYGVALDSAENVYVCGDSGAGGTNVMALLKYNSSGTIQWQRSLRPLTSSANGWACAVDVSGNPYFCGTSNVSGSAALFAKLTAAGTKTGAYSLNSVNYGYLSTSVTNGNGSFSASASSLTEGAAGITGSNSVITSATASITSAVTTI